MKRKVKRKMFLMGMAIAASLPAGAFAQGSGKVERNGSHYSSGGRGATIPTPVDVIQEAPEMRINDESGGTPPTLLDKLKGMVGSLSSRAEAVSASDQYQALKLELSRTEPVKLGSTDNPKVTTGNPVGVSLRLTF